MTVDMLESMEKVEDQMLLETSRAGSAQMGGMYHKQSNISTSI